VEPPKPEPPKPQVADAEPIPRPHAKPQPPKPEPPKPEPPKPAKVEPPKPEPPKPKHETAKAEPPKPAKPEPAKPAKAEPAKPSPAKPQVASKPDSKAEAKEAKKDAKPAPEFDVNAILNNLRPTARQQDRRPPAPTPPRQQSASAAPVAAPSLSQHLTSSETDAVRRQIESCWSFVGGGKEVQHIEVEIRVQMNPDATVREARIVDAGRNQSDPLYRSVAESARRAILNPECSPLRLPRDKYDLWKSFTFIFSPRDFGT
jgi:hypothetical protein